MLVSRSKSHDRLVSELIRSGLWLLRPKGRRRHAYIQYIQTGYKVPVPFSPSDRRSFQNFKAMVKKAEA